MQNCIDMCWRCRHECQAVLFNYCLIEGGKHVAEPHVKLMVDCIQMCQVAADAMVRQSPMHADICAACAAVCDACAISCEALEGTEMKICAELCRQCAEQCRDMGSKKSMGRLTQSSDGNWIRV